MMKSDSLHGSAPKRLAAPQGFEPRYADPESAVLPLNEGAASAPCLIRERKSRRHLDSRIRSHRGQLEAGIAPSLFSSCSATDNLRRFVRDRACPEHTRGGGGDFDF